MITGGDSPSLPGDPGNGPNRILILTALVLMAAIAAKFSGLV